MPVDPAEPETPDPSTEPAPDTPVTPAPTPEPAAPSPIPVPACILPDAVVLTDESGQPIVDLSSVDPADLDPDVLAALTEAAEESGMTLCLPE